MIELLPDHKHKKKQAEYPRQFEELGPPIVSKETSNPNSYDSLKSSVPSAIIEPLNVEIYVKPRRRPVKVVEVPQEVESPSHIHEMLTKMVPYSRTSLNNLMIKEIYRRKRLAYDRVYQSYINDPQEYLRFIYHAELDLGKQVRVGLYDIIWNKIEGMQGDIQNGELKVYKKEILNKYYLNNLVRYRESYLKSKLYDLRQSINSTEETIDILSDDYYSKNHPRTKYAEYFVRNMNRYKEYQKRRFHEARKKRELLYYKLKQYRDEYNSKLKEQYRQRVLQRIDKRQEIKEKYEQEKKEQILKIRKFIKKYNLTVPLYKEKQEQFSELLSYEMERYQAKLEQIKEERESLGINYIDEHDRKFMEFLHDDMIRRKYQRKLEQEAEKFNPKYFKGQYRYQVLEQMLEEKQVYDPKMVNRMKKVRQLIYSDDVKNHFTPRIDLDKKKYLENMVKNQQTTRRKSESEAVTIYNGRIKRTVSPELQANSYSDGIRNLQSLHRLIEVSKKYGKIKKSMYKTSVTLYPKPNYLKYLRYKRTTNFRPSVDTIDAVPDVDHFERMKLKADQLDKHVYRRYRLLRINKSMDIDDSNKLYYDYIESIKAKLSLLHTKYLPAT